MVSAKIYYKDKLYPCDDWISSYKAFKLRNFVLNSVAFGLLILHQKSKMGIGDNNNDGQCLSRKVQLSFEEMSPYGVLIFVLDG